VIPFKSEFSYHHHHHDPRISSRRKSWNKTSGPLCVSYYTTAVMSVLLWPIVCIAVWSLEQFRFQCTLECPQRQQRYVKIEQLLYLLCIKFHCICISFLHTTLTLRGESHTALPLGIHMASLQLTGRKCLRTCTYKTWYISALLYVQQVLAELEPKTSKLKTLVWQKYSPGLIPLLNRHNEVYVVRVLALCIFG